jgi:ribonucleoside-diphosphate reductase alpha chain
MSQQFLDRDYLLPGQTLDERVDLIVAAAQQLLGSQWDGKKFKENLAKGWYSLSTPIWSNFGTDRGLPISCFGSTPADDMASILYTQAEIGMMSKYGGGTSVFLGNLRPRGASIRNNGESSGAVHFAQIYENTINLISQGGVRRGSCAIYLNVDHDDIEEFLTIRSEGSPLQDINFGVTVPDAWMKSMIAGDSDKRKVWAKVLETRANTGYPYIMFTGTANMNAPDVYKDQGMEITHSNLCSEIFLPDNEDESFVCDLSSMNILHYDDWKGTDAVKLLTFFLDAVMSEFIQKASKIKFLDRAVRFAERHRAIGIGWLGWHSYLQSKMVPFESMEAKLLNVEVAQTIKKQAYAASGELAAIFGEPYYLKGYGRRNTTLMAIAPTKSSAFILGQVSEGIEPIRSNYFIDDKAKGKFTQKNLILTSLLETKGQNTPEVWNSILTKAGSVQHLDILTDHERAVFKTFSEISPKEIIIQAGARQRFIDQGQSLNLMIHPSMPIKDVNALYILAWELGVKSLYYQISVNAAQEFSRSLMDCVSCSA